MPTYRNNSKKRVPFNGKVVEPGREVHSLAFYDEVQIGLYKVHDKPFYNTILLATQVSKETTLEIPLRDELNKWVSKYTIHFHVASASENITIYYNDASNKPGLSLYNGARWNERCLERKINKVIIKSKGDFILDVIVEKL